MINKSTQYSETFFIVAGEKSADNHGAVLMQAIRTLNPKAQFVGIGGNKMLKVGLKSLEKIERLSIMGFIEVIKHLSFFHKLIKKILEEIKFIQPIQIILIDYPGFNLRLAKKIKDHFNIPITYYISPQLWAWKEGRIEIIRKYNIEDGDFLIGIQAGSSIKGRRWSPKAFAELADGLVEQQNAKIILFGVSSEKSLSEEIKSFATHKDKLVNLTGKTTIGQLSTLVKGCAYLVTNDTGTMHIAAAVGTPTIGLFFAHAHPFETGPYSPGHLIFQARISCAPCSYGVECNDTVCVRKVHPDHILSMIKTHQKEGQWHLAESMSDLEEINIYSTYIGEDRRLRLRPLVKHSLGLNDIFREIYTALWLDSLERVKTYGLVPCNIEKLLLED